jgi:hypothetical protein
MTVEEMLAEAEIRKVQMRYCRGADRMDFELMRSCFHPDARLEFGFFGGSVDEFIDSGKQMLATFLGTTHFTGNQLVEVNGEEAWAEHYTVATHRLPLDESGPLRDFVTAVRYVDRVERRDGAWKIARRVCILDWWRSDPVEEAGPGPEVQGGRRDRSDASYSVT